MPILARYGRIWLSVPLMNMLLEYSVHHLVCAASLAPTALSQPRSKDVPSLRDFQTHHY